MHPYKDLLKSLVEGKLDNDLSEEITTHIDTCELCAEFCQDYRLFIDTLNEARLEEIGPDAREIANRIYWDAVRANIIPLIVLESRLSDSNKAVLLAADGQEESGQTVINLATLFSENPEVVLRVMRDAGKGEDYIQVISQDKELVSHVLVQATELGMELMTDEKGYATIQGQFPAGYENIKWQIKYPQAVFKLEPLLYDPEKIESSKGIILETDNQDKVKIDVLRKARGRQITLSILELGGQSEFGNTRVVISQKRKNSVHDASSHETVTFDIADSNDSIDIRIFSR